MIVTQHDLESGKLAILPPDWRTHGTARQALAVQGRRWQNQLANHRNMRTLPSGSGLVVGADSDRGILIERVPKRWCFRVLLFAIVPGSPSAEILTREVPADFDVVEVASSQVLASVRGAPRESSSGATGALLTLCLLLLALVGACGPTVSPLPGVPQCRPPHPPMDLAVPTGCQPCTITYCRGPELPPCSAGCSAPLSCLPDPIGFPRVFEESDHQGL